MNEITLEQLAETQHRVSVLTEVTNALKDSTKVLTDETIRDLLHFAQKTAFASDATMPFRAASQLHKNEKLYSSLVPLWNRMNDLQRQMDDIRKYHGFDTAQALKEAVEAGRRTSVSPTAPTAHHIPASDRDRIIAKAKERAAQAKAKAEAAQK